MDEDFLVNELVFDDEDDGGVVRRRKVYRERVNFDNFLSEWEFKERFRMTSNKLELLMSEIGHAFHHSSKGGGLTPKQQVCVGLHWMGSGSQYHTVGDMHGISKTTVQRCVRSLVEAVNRHLFRTVVAWPENIADVINKFYQVANFPHVFGVVDGTLITIDAPTGNEAVFVDRHNDHSLNCMFVCGPTCMIYYVSARWPGSVHDGRVMRTSNLYRHLETRDMFPDAVLLGDSGYPLKRCLMVPHHENPHDIGEQRYNQRLKSTRQIIERCLGILKEKFPCLNHLRLDPVYTAEVVKCCATLCNIARQHEEEEVALDDHVAEEAEVLPDEDDDEDVRPGVLRQRAIINAMR